MRIVLLMAALFLGTAAVLLLAWSTETPSGSPIGTDRSADFLKESAASAASLEPEDEGPLRVLTESSTDDEPGFRTDSEAGLLEESHKARIEVTVLGPDHAPRAGATVTLEPTAGSATSDSVLSRSLQTNTSGQVVFPVPRAGLFSLQASWSDLRSARMPAVRPGGSVVLLLERGQMFVGQIVAAEDGRAVPGALLLFTVEDRIHQSFCGPDGRFELDVPARARGRLEVLARGFARHQSWIDVQQAPPRIPLEAGHLLRGKVIESFETGDTDGTGVRDAVVRTLARREAGGEELTVVLAESRTDASGEFSLGPTACDDVELEVSTHRGDRVSLELDRSAARQPLQVVLPARRRLAGHVFLADGRPAAGARIRLLGLESSEASKRRVTADDDGRFEIDRIQARRPYRLAAWHPEGTPALLERQPDADPAPFEIRLAPRNGIRGLVRRADGGAAPFAVLRLEQDDPGLVRAAGLREALRADDQGRFQIRAVPPGTWKLGAAFFEEAAGPVEVVVVAGQETELTLELEGRASIEGQLTDTLGQPLSPGIVRANPAADPARPGQSAEAALAEIEVDAAGRFRFDLLPPGRPIELLASSPGYEDQVVAIPLPERSGPVVIRMQALLALEGQVRDSESGAALERFSLTVEWTGADGRARERKRAFVGARGSFRFEGLEEGEVELTVQSDGYFRFGPETVMVQPGAIPLLIQLYPAAELEGRLLDDRGRPIAGTLVFLRELLPPGEEPKIRRSRSRAGGGFTLRELHPGRYELGVGREDAPLALTGVKIDFGRNTVQDIRLSQVGSVELELSGPDGRGAGEQVVRFVGQTLKARLDVVSDGRGRAEAGPLPADTYDVLSGGARGTCHVRAGAVTPLRLIVPEEDSEQ